MSVFYLCLLIEESFNVNLCILILTQSSHTTMRSNKKIWKYLSNKILDNLWKTVNCFSFYVFLHEKICLTNPLFKTLFCS